MWGTGVFVAILRRPRLWGEALRAASALAARSWWTRSPRLPVPEPTYAAWRRATAYGSADVPLNGKDVIAFLAWRRRFRRSLSRSGVTSG